MTCFKTFLTRFSSSKFELDKIFRDMYQIDYIHGNDFDAVVSRLFYVQAHENSSWLPGLQFNSYLFLCAYMYQVCMQNELQCLYYYYDTVYF